MFKILLRRCQADCVLDIGSCDGSASLVFRQALPAAQLIAFEANPHLYQAMAADPLLRRNRIEVFPYAITNTSGSAPFHVADVEYQARRQPGTSSLLIAEGGWVLKETVEVQTCRVDEFVLSRYPQAKRVGLWIDAEGAEFGVMEGISRIKERVVAVHVETARQPMRVGQKLYAELLPLMTSLGFTVVCTNMTQESLWGDVVFVSEKMRVNLGTRFHLCHWAGRLSSLCRANLAGMFLREHCYPVYRPLARLYFKLFT